MKNPERRDDRTSTGVRVELLDRLIISLTLLLDSGTSDAGWECWRLCCLSVTSYFDANAENVHLCPEAKFSRFNLLISCHLHPCCIESRMISPSVRALTLSCCDTNVWTGRQTDPIVIDDNRLRSHCPTKRRFSVGFVKRHNELLKLLLQQTLARRGYSAAFTFQTHTLSVTNDHNQASTDERSGQE